MLSGDWIDRLNGIAIVWRADVVVASIKVIVVLVIAALVLRSERSASFRHFVWFLAITSLVALTLLPYVLPQWRTPISAATMIGWLPGSVDRSIIVGPADAETTTRGALFSSLMEEAPLAQDATLGHADRLHAQAAAVPKRHVPTHVWVLVLWFLVPFPVRGFRVFRCCA